MCDHPSPSPELSGTEKTPLDTEEILALVEEAYRRAGVKVVVFEIR
jgi:hypothetical protein